MAMVHSNVDRNGFGARLARIRERFGPRLHLRHSLSPLLSGERLASRCRSSVHFPLSLRSGGFATVVGGGRRRLGRGRRALEPEPRPDCDGGHEEDDRHPGP